MKRTEGGSQGRLCRRGREVRTIRPVSRSPPRRGIAIRSCSARPTAPSICAQANCENRIPRDGITKITAVSPAETADCPRWLQFLNETFGDADLIRFIQQWCGYCLTGDIREHALVFGSGNGGNGKSDWLSTIAGIMSDYAMTAAMETFTASKFDRHPTELAMLRGARMVTAARPRRTARGRKAGSSR